MFSNTIAIIFLALLALQSVDAWHPFGNSRDVRYANQPQNQNQNRVSSGDSKDSKKIKDMLRITYTDWLEMQLLQAEKKLQRNARSSHSTDNDGELPEHVINLLPLPLRNMMRERNSKRISGPDVKSVPYGSKGSYMSLCHFKICTNTGRKRSIRSAPSTKQIYRNPFVRQ